MKFLSLSAVVAARFVPHAEVNIYPDEEAELHVKFEVYDELDVIRGRGYLKGGSVKVDFTLEQQMIRPNGMIEFANVYNEGLKCTWENIESDVFISHLMTKLEKFFAEERNMEDFLLSYTPTAMAAVLNDRAPEAYGPDYFGFYCEATLEPELKVF